MDKTYSNIHGAVHLSHTHELPRLCARCFLKYKVFMSFDSQPGALCQPCCQTSCITARFHRPCGKLYALLRCKEDLSALASLTSLFQLALCLWPCCKTYVWTSMMIGLRLNSDEIHRCFVKLSRLHLQCIGDKLPICR